MIFLNKKIILFTS